MNPNPSDPNALEGHYESAEANAFYAEVYENFEVQTGDSLQIDNICKSLDRLVQVRRRLEDEGITQFDSLGNVKPHPLMVTERQLVETIAKLNRFLGLNATERNPRPAKWKPTLA